MLATPSAPATSPAHVPAADAPAGLRGLLASAARIPVSLTTTYVDSLRSAHPGATPAEIAYLLARRYQFAVSLAGVATGLTALRPLGTGAAAGLTAAHLTGAAGASSLYLLALCRVHGITEADTVQRVVSRCALGATGVEPIEYQLGLGPSSWYAETLARVPVGHVRWTRQIADRSLARAARKHRVSPTAGALPFGIGATLGFASGRLLAQRVIDAAESHLGSPPEAFADAPELVVGEEL